MTKRILIVDDDDPTRQLLLAVMRREGLDADIAAGGGEAIECLRARHYDAAVLDLMMPNVTGRDVVEFIAAQPRRTPVVICTAANPKSVELDPEIVRAVIQKPFEITGVRDTVLAILLGLDRDALLRIASGIIYNGELSRERLSGALRATKG